MASAFSPGVRPLLRQSLATRGGLLLPDDATVAGARLAGTENSQRDFFYRPLNAWAGDFIPYWQNGQFHLFFLLDWRDRSAHGEGTPWYQVTTQDFVHFEERGEMLPRGTKDDQDLYVFTGSVIYGEGKYHTFYTGHNPYFREQGKPEQGVMHAESSDLLHWEKIAQDTFYAPAERFESNDWRDPFVFWNSEANEYWMLLAARLKSGPSRRRGCTALCSSKDLKKWKVRDPFWTPHLFFTHECPDLFRIGDWWYLVFSEFTDLTRTRYRMSRSLEGPWIAPKYDYFDARAFYAAKTASDGNRRFLFGWSPTHAEKRDYQRWDWGGNLIVHELHQQKDGTLSIDVPASVDSAWNKSLLTRFAREEGVTKRGENHIEINAAGTFVTAAAGPMPNRCKIEVQIRFAPGTRRCGIALRTSDDLESSYYVQLEPQNQRLVFDSWPRAVGEEHSVSGTDEGYMPGLDRWISLTPRTPINLKVFVDGTLGVAYINSQIALSFRMYDLPAGQCGFFVEQGGAEFMDIKVSALSSASTL